MKADDDNMLFSQAISARPRRNVVAVPGASRDLVKGLVQLMTSVDFAKLKLKMEQGP